MEHWRTIPGLNAYEVSDLGRVRRVAPYRSTFAGRVLKPCRHRDGHLIVRLSKNGKAHARYVHRLVADVFLGPAPSPAHIVAHWDGDPAHNAVTNLRWATHSENIQDRRRHGTYPDGSLNPNAKLSDLEVQLIRAHAAFGERRVVICWLFDISDTHLSNIIKGKVRREAGGYLP